MKSKRRSRSKIVEAGGTPQERLERAEKKLEQILEKKHKHASSLERLRAEEAELQNDLAKLKEKERQLNEKCELPELPAVKQTSPPPTQPEPK